MLEVRAPLAAVVLLEHLNAEFLCALGPATSSNTGVDARLVRIKARHKSSD